MSALELLNISDSIPVESTYYLLRKRIVGHDRKTGVNLLEKSFAQITKGQVLDFNVSGKLLRMDNKLIGSNIPGTVVMN